MRMCVTTTTTSSRRQVRGFLQVLVVLSVLLVGRTMGQETATENDDSSLLTMKLDGSEPILETFGRQKASLDVPSMTYDISYRQNLCERYEEFQNGTVELKDALEGMQLNVLMMAYPDGYFNYDDESGIDSENPGLVAVLMDELARRGGFTWRDSFGVNRGPANGTSWTDLLLWGIESYDINADWWAQNLDRMNSGVAFLTEWYDSSIILITKEGEEVIIEEFDFQTFTNFLKPYKLEVWLLTIVTVLLSGFVYQILEWLAGARNNRTMWEWWLENWYLSAINFTQAYEYQPRNAAMKIFGVSMALWALVMTATYTANLASLLVDRGFELQTVRQIEQISEEKVCTWEGTNSDSFLKKNHPRVTRVPKQSLLAVYQGLQNGECQFAAETVASWLEHQGREEFNPSCDLTWLGTDRKVQDVAAGFATKADSGFLCSGLIRDVINWHMSDMIGDGFLEDAWDREYQKSQDLDCNAFGISDPTLEGSETATSSTTPATRVRRQRHLASSSSSARPTSKSKRQPQRQQRELKAGGKAAAASGSIAVYGDSSSESERLTLNQMIGIFAFHWFFLLVSIGLALATIYYDKHMKKNEAKNMEKTIAIRIGSCHQTARTDSDLALEESTTGVRGGALHTSASLVALEEKTGRLYDSSYSTIQEQTHPNTAGATTTRTDSLAAVLEQVAVVQEEMITMKAQMTSEIKGIKEQLHEENQGLKDQIQLLLKAMREKELAC